MLGWTPDSPPRCTSLRDAPARRPTRRQPSRGRPDAGPAAHEARARMAARPARRRPAVQRSALRAAAIDGRPALRRSEKLRLAGSSAAARPLGIEQALPVSNPIQVLVPAPLRSRALTGGSSSATRRCSTSPSTGAARSACRVPPGRPSTPRRPHRRTSRHEPSSSPRPSRARHGERPRALVARPRAGGLTTTARGSGGRGLRGLVRPRGRPAASPLLVHGPPRGVGQPRGPRLVGRRLTTPDAWFDDVALAIMVHSRQWHADELEWESTVEHDTDLQAAASSSSVSPRTRSARDRAGSANASRRHTSRPGRPGCARTSSPSHATRGWAERPVRDDAPGDGA